LSLVLLRVLFIKKCVLN